ncbi:MAG: helix-turn-helix domain-containing protein [Verrucomicrobiales bacterium]|nr:helix-turn-helix domain-containing protein [Verrucomicrobiales bacterium]
MIERPLLTKKDIAKFCNVTTRTIDNWREHEGLPVYKLGKLTRFRMSDIETWVEEKQETNTSNT